MRFFAMLLILMGLCVTTIGCSGGEEDADTDTAEPAAAETTE